MWRRFAQTLVNFNNSASISQKHFSGPQNRRKLTWTILSLGTFTGIYTAVKVNLKHKQVLYCKENVHPQVIDSNEVQVQLFQYQTCPFCCKVRAFLQAYNIPFEVVEVHPIFKKELKFSDTKKVPQVLITQGNNVQHLKDSSLIISALSTHLANPGSSMSEIITLYPHVTEMHQDGKSKEVILNRHDIMDLNSKYTDNVGTVHDPHRLREETEWRRWVDEHFVHIISPNVYRTYREAYQAFAHHVKMGKYNGTWEGWVAKIGGSTAMFFVSKKLKKKYHLNDDVRLDLYAACNQWMDAVGKKRKFMGGDKPNLADLSMYGAMSVMEGLDVFDDILKYSKIKKWYYRTKLAIEKHDVVDLQRY